MSQLRHKRGSLDTDFDQCVFLCRLEDAGVPRKVAPHLMMRSSLIFLPVAHRFLAGDPALELVGVDHPVLVFYREHLTIGTVAHESAHYAQWLTRLHGEGRVMRWLGLLPTDVDAYNRYSRKDEAEAHLLEQILTASIRTLKQHGGVMVTLEPPEETRLYTGDASAINRTVSFRF